MVVDPTNLRAELVRACRHAGLDPERFVVWIVEAPQPPGATPIAYLHPDGAVRSDTVQVFRAVGAERAAAHAGSSHRLAVWRELPGLPEAALGAILRHELAHAARWERSGTAFYEADERLRAAVDGRSYPLLPTEREANAAAAAYAREQLDDAQLAEVAAVPALRALLGAHPPADVVRETLALAREHVDAAPAAPERAAAGLRVEVVAPAELASGGMH